MKSPEVMKALSEMWNKVKEDGDDVMWNEKAKEFNQSQSSDEASSKAASEKDASSDEETPEKKKEKGKQKAEASSSSGTTTVEDVFGSESELSDN